MHPAPHLADPERDLGLRRLIPAPPAAVWRAWTEPDLLCRWFTPAPWTTVRAELDVRPGGSSLIVMRSPDGQEFPNRGVYLEVAPGRRLVCTDAYTAAWVPSAKPFVTIELDLAPMAGGTDYHARVHHWTAADRQAHLDMGFDAGWNAATDQLAALVRAMPG